MIDIGPIQVFVKVDSIYLKGRHQSLYLNHIQTRKIKILTKNLFIWVKSET